MTVLLQCLLLLLGVSTMPGNSGEGNPKVLEQQRPLLEEVAMLKANPPLALVWVKPQIMPRPHFQRGEAP